MTAKVADLLDATAAELERLAGMEDLPDEVSTDVTDTLRAVEAGRAAIGSARGRLRTTGHGSLTSGD